jgi:hypothetical protein
MGGLMKPPESAIDQTVTVTISGNKLEARPTDRQRVSRKIVYNQLRTAY